MPLQIDSFLFILRLLMVILLYLFLMQTVVAITRDMRKTASLDTNAAATSSRIHGHLVVVDSGSSSLLPGMSFDLEPHTTIGRGPTNIIQIPDGSISTEHSYLTFRNGTWYAQDAGSVNGTFVNNMPAREPLPARVGDIIRVGYIQFKLTP